MSDAFSAITQTAAKAAGVADWYALLRPASFRGIPFHVETGGAASGRRTALHEYPGRDVPYAEDLGRKAWTYTFSAYCVGTLYPLQRELLLKACTAKGPGTLVHPSFGTKKVICTDVSVQEERTSANYCSFSLSFAEAGLLEMPDSSTNTTSAIEGTSGGLTSASAGDFANGFTVSGFIGSVVDGAMSDVSSFMSDIQGLVVSPLSDLGSGLTGALGDLGLNASSLIYDAPLLATKIGAVTGAYGLAQAAAPVVTGMTLMGSLFTAHSVPGTAPGTAPSRAARAARDTTPTPAPATAARRQEAANAAAFQRLVRQLSLVEVALAVPGLDLTSAQDAADLRTTLAAAFEAAQDDAGNAGLDASYTALVDLENAVLTHITQRMLQLPALVTYSLNQSPNAIALAWKLYQDPDRCDELVDRTNAVNPAFLPNTGRVLSS